MGQHAHSEDVVKRLAKIEGHIRGIRRMLDEDQPCDQVLIQMSAVMSALRKATRILLEDHYDHCLLEKNADAALGRELIDFKKILGDFVR